MNWLKLGKYVGKFAPLLGSVLGGPAGGAIGSIIATALGVENDPSKIFDALNKSEDQKTLLRKLQYQHKNKLTELEFQHANILVKEVNKTMREELVHGNWLQKCWRPVLGLTFSFGWLGVMAGIIWILFTGGNPELLGGLAALSVLFATPMPILGAAAYGRSNEKIASMTGQQTNGIFSAISDRISGKAAQRKNHPNHSLPNQYGGQASGEFNQETFFSEGAG